ncbi:MFS transporter [Candidatus Peregrinibacteria bacterium]|nr:MFS transporter [Candidatus Peregrinibacteria bacterium]
MTQNGQTYQQKLQSNVWKLYALGIIHWFLLVMPIIVLFYQENGLSIAQIMFLQGFASLVIVGIEIPSGYFADHVGRKHSLLVGSILGFLGALIYAFSFNLWGFLFAEFFISLGMGFISGADSALLYDSLEEIKKGELYKIIQGKLSALSSFSEGTASVIGGGLAIISLRTPFFVEAAVVFFSIFVALSLNEPKRHIAATPESHGRQIWNTVKYVLNDHKKIKNLMWYGAFISSATLTFVWLSQPYWKSMGVPLAMFGIIWAILQFIVGYFSIISHKIEKNFGRDRLLFYFIVLLALGYISISVFQSVWAIGFVVIFYIVRGVQEPLLKAYINELVPSQMRATILSVKSFLGRIVFAVIGPFIGWSADVYTLSQAFLFSAILFFVLGIIPLIFLYHGRQR